MLQAVISGVVNKMGDLLIQEGKFLYGVSDQIELVKLQLHQMQCFLKDADSKQKKDERVKGWVQNIRDVAYETEDAIDTYLCAIAPSQWNGVGIFKKFALKPVELSARHRLGEKISMIQMKLKIISEGRTTFGIENLGDERSETKAVAKGVVNNDYCEIIGFQDAERSLIAQLVASVSDQRRRVVSIVGQGGLGKTTLAQKIYNSKEVKEHFDITLWLTVSSDFKIIDILKEAIQKLAGSAIKENESNEQFLLEEMKNILGAKRYLVVLDDVWGMNFYDMFRKALPDGDNSSRVLMTSRSLDVAKRADPASVPYKLHFLNNDESLKLLLSKALPHESAASSCHVGPDLVDVAKNLARLCGGLPLALVVVGGLLSVRDPTYDNWNRFLQTMDWQSDGVECMEVLVTSYQDLPIFLKPCFLYFACFPEDYEIHKGPLLRMWIAEGFIQHEERQELEDTAERYLEQLAQRCMVQVSKRNLKCGTIKRCRVHDLLRELAIKESKDNNFLQVNPRQKGVQHPAPRRVSYFQTDVVKICKNNNLRSLLIFDVHTPSCQIWFRLLRILELKGVGTIETLPTEVTNMVHLRYLGLRGSNVNSLPEKIGRLQNLQTLDIRGTALTAAPVSLWNITALRHVHTDWSRAINGPPKGSKLESLLTLKYVKVMAWEEGKWPDCVSLNAAMLPLHITQLVLYNTRIEQDPMPELEKLQSIKILCLMYNAITCKKISCFAGGFPQLQRLWLVINKSLEEWYVEEGSLPVLKYLYIQECWGLKTLPDLHYVTSLQELELRSMLEEFNSRIAQSDGADWHKIRHIPSIRN
ncbi:hypothetical protein LUZ61_000193 [Rhynchospora tenuis]|uniref:Disease resistance protein n=1 Tax=Rhynchospora tenuis TaxID=198213 RepID=A0AAD5ZEW9_9POAL|nr:hypothetical protein LUZ61_000193 [Rhynchospora tenuis]